MATMFTVSLPVVGWVFAKAARKISHTYFSHAGRVTALYLRTTEQQVKNTRKTGLPDTPLR